jgi:hypothetical protein
LIDGRWQSRVGDGAHRHLRYEADVQHVLRGGVGVISPLGVGALRGSDAHRCPRCEDNTQCVPGCSAGVVDLLWFDSQRGAAFRLATVAPSPPPVARRVAGRTRMLLFCRREMPSSSSPSLGESTTVVIVVPRGEELHVVAAIAGHELEAPEAEHRPGLKRLLKTPHLELHGRVFVNTQQAPTWRANYRRFRTGGSLDRPVNLSLRVPAQMGWCKMEHKGEMRLVLSRTRGCARSRGYKRRERERERERARARARGFVPLSAALPTLLPSFVASRTPPRRALDLPFIDARRGSRCTMGGIAMR